MIKTKAIFTGNWANKFYSAALVSVILLIMLVLLVMALYVYFRDPPFTVRSLSRPSDEHVCPDETYNVEVEIETKSPVIIFIYVSNMLPNGSHILHPSQPGLPPIPYPEMSFFVQSFPWVVPDLPSGTYMRVLGFRGHDTDEKPLIVLQPFVIAEDCPRREDSRPTEASDR